MPHLEGVPLGERGSGQIRVENADMMNVQRLFRMIEKSIDSTHVDQIKDPVERALLEATIPELFNGGRLRPHIDEVFAARRQRNLYYPTGYALRSYELSVDYQMKSIFPLHYPQEFGDLDAWQQNNVFGRLDPNALFIDMNRNVASNIPQAYAFFNILCHKFIERWGRPPVVVDTGGAMGQPLKKWKLHEEFPFQNLKMYNMPELNQPISNLESDTEAQLCVDELNSLPPSLGQAVGYDILPIYDMNDEAVSWVYSNSFPMSEEVRRPDAANEFINLVYEEVDEVKIIKRNIDARDPDSLKNLKEFLPDGKADFFIFSGVIYEMTPEETAQVFRNLVPYCNKNALYSVNEWAAVDRWQPSGLRVISEKWWHRPGKFGNFLIDPFNLDKPPVPLGYFLNRKCEEMMLTKQGRHVLLD